MSDLESRIVFAPDTSGSNRPQISTDGWPSYQSSVKRSFGKSATHGVLVKKFADPEVGRYSPPELRKAERINIHGIADLFTICTSHVERNNLTIRTFLRTARAGGSAHEWHTDTAYGRRKRAGRECRTGR